MLNLKIKTILKTAQARDKTLTKFLWPILVCGLFVVVLGLSDLSAQSQIIESEPSLRLSFNRQNNFTFSTRIESFYRYKTDKYRLEWRLYLDNLLNSRLDDPVVQLYIHNDILQYYTLSPKWELASWIESDQFFNSNSYRYSAYGGVNFKPFPWLKIRPLVGYSLDTRSGIQDKGFSPAIFAESEYKFDDGSFLQIRGRARSKYIRPRHQRNIMLSSFYSRNFNEFSAISVGVRVGGNELDDYKLKSIEKIKSDTLSGQLGLSYKLFPGVYWESNNTFTLTRREFDYETFTAPEAEFNDLKYQQVNIFTQQKISLAAKKLSGFFKYEYLYLNRGYDLENNQDLADREFDRLLSREKQKDYFRKLTNIELFLKYPLNPKHNLTLTGSNRYLQYDTPAAENFDDLDELNYALTGEIRSTWSRSFSTRYKLLGLVRQYAFLFKERSQDNYTQRTLRMEFDYRWQMTDKISLSGEQYIYVTYNVKDFNDRNLTDRSTRNLESRLDFRYRPSSKWESQTKLYRKEIHVSYLNWEAFTETTLDTTTTYLLDHTNRLLLKNKWENARIFLNVGYKHFSQFRFQNTSMTNLNNVLTPINLHIRYHQTGAQTGIRFIHRKPASLDLNIWWQLQIQNFKFRELEAFSSLGRNYRETDLRKTTLFFRPFMQLDMNIAL